jgi:hypothetical protein
MNFNRALDNVGLKLLKVFERIVPEGSDLDTLFNSYDDWRKMRHPDSTDQVPKVESLGEKD